MDGHWSAHLLLEFLNAASTVPHEAAALHSAVEQAADAFEAEAAAAVRGDEVVAHVGFPRRL